jgi:hypothetical protein
VGDAVREERAPAHAAARLRWLYRRTPFFDERYLLYPVGREL